MLTSRTDRTHAKITQPHQRIVSTREQLAILDEQLVQVQAEADDARTRALVSETPIASRDYDHAARQVAAMQRTRASLVAEITRLTATRDDLIDSLPTE